MHFSVVILLGIEREGNLPQFRVWITAISET